MTLAGGDSIENVVGTSFNDTILGNSRNNAIYGAAGSDTLNGRAGNHTLVAGLPAVVLLDFDSGYNAARGDYNYSVAERNTIQQRIEADYAKFSLEQLTDGTVIVHESLQMLFGIEWISYLSTPDLGYARFPCELRSRPILNVRLGKSSCLREPRILSVGIKVFLG